MPNADWRVLRCGPAVRGYAAGMGNRSERRLHSDQGSEVRGTGRTSTSVSRLLKRRSGSRDRPLDRITQREGAYPSWAYRSESGARSYADGPGQGWTLQVSGAGNAGKSLTVQPLLPHNRANGRVWGLLRPDHFPCSARHGPPLRQEPSSATDPGSAPAVSTARSAPWHALPATSQSSPSASGPASCG